MSILGSGYGQGAGGVLQDVDFRIINESLVIAAGNDSVPFITDVTGSLAPNMPALLQTSWGPNGPNAALQFDEARNALIEKSFRGHTFSGVTKGLGRVKMPN